MTGYLDFGMDEYNEKDDIKRVEYPPRGSYQVVKVEECEYRQSQTSDASWLNIKGTFERFPGTTFFKKLWIPTPGDDEEKFRKSVSRFLGQLVNMGLKPQKGMSYEAIAQSLIGHFAYGRVIAEENEKDPERPYMVPYYFGALEDGDIQSYPQPSPQVPAQGFHPQQPAPQAPQAPQGHYGQAPQQPAQGYGQAPQGYPQAAPPAQGPYGGQRYDQGPPPAPQGYGSPPPRPYGS